MLKWIEAIPYVETKGLCAAGDREQRRLRFACARPSRSSRRSTSRAISGRAARLIERPRSPRFITPQGFARIRAEYEELFGIERPKIVETIVLGRALTATGRKTATTSTAASACARSTAGSAISPRIMKAAKIVDPAPKPTRPGPLRSDRRACRRGRQAPHHHHCRRRRSRCRGRADRLERTAGPGTLIGARIGDERIVQLPSGEKSYEVVAISYPALGGAAGAPTSSRRLGGHAFAHASAIADRAAIAAWGSSLPSIIRHGDQRVSELARSSATAAAYSGSPATTDRVAWSAPRVLPSVGQAPLLDLGATSKYSFTSRVP